MYILLMMRKFFVVFVTKLINSLADFWFSHCPAFQQGRVMLDQSCQFPSPVWMWSTLAQAPALSASALCKCTKSYLGFWAPPFICCVNVLTLDSNCPIALIFRLVQTFCEDMKRLEQIYLNTHPHLKKIVTTNLYTCISHWDWLEVFSPLASFFYLNVFRLYSNCYMEPYLQNWFSCSKFLRQFQMTGANIFEQTPYFLWKPAIHDASDGFMGNIYINITCSSQFWIHAYQIC